MGVWWSIVWEEQEELWLVGDGGDGLPDEHPRAGEQGG